MTEFQSRCRDWVVGELAFGSSASAQTVSFSLVAEIGWLARVAWVHQLSRSTVFQSRCRDWVVGEDASPRLRNSIFKFQSRCRDWVVGERQWKRALIGRQHVSVSLPRLGGWRGYGGIHGPLWQKVSVSLPRLGGWRGLADHPQVLARLPVSVSLPRLGGWRVLSLRGEAGWRIKFQSRCRDWVVGEMPMK